MLNIGPAGDLVVSAILQRACNGEVQTLIDAQTTQSRAAADGVPQNIAKVLGARHQACLGVRHLRRQT
jgi:hypothetical protein